MILTLLCTRAVMAGHCCLNAQGRPTVARTAEPFSHRLPPQPVSLLLLLLLFAILLLPFQALAETQGAGKYQQWKKNVEQTERLLEKQDADIKELETMRQKLAAQREEAVAIGEKGSVRLRTLQAQLDALGPAPAEGETESEQIATRRTELEKELARANEPLLKAEEVVQQSDVLIKELDSAIRQRTATALLVRDPAPIFPTRWMKGAAELADAFKQELHSLRIVLTDPYVKTTLKNRLPLALFLFLLGIATITVVRSLVLRRLAERYAGSEREGLFNWSAVVINCAHLALPALSTVFLIAGFYLLHVDLYVLKKSISFLPLLAVVFTVGHWLGHSLFAPGQAELRPTRLDDAQAGAGYRNLLLLGLVLSLQIALQLLEIDYTFSETARASLSLPIILLGSLLLWRFSTVLVQARRNVQGDSETSDTESAIEGALLLLLSQALKAAAVFSTLFILLGFTALAREILAPMIVTVALLGLAFFIYRIITALLEPLFSRTGEAADASPTLFPIFVLFILVILTLPLLALTWGVRWATIVEIWWALNEGIKIGDTHISLDIIVLLTVIFLLGLALTRWLQKIFRVAILPRTKLDIGGQNALVTGIGYTGITLSVLIAISSAGLDLSSLAILAGALSVGIGFGLQTIASNFVSGIILLIERPIKEGDWIDVSGHSGYVRKISVRSTRIETFDRHDVIIPNADLVAGVVKNMTLTGMTGRIIVPVGVAYGSDAEEVKRILLEIADGHQMVLKYPEPTILFIGLGESSIDFELRCFVRDVNAMLTVRSDIYFAVYRRLGEEGIEIPFPQRVVTMKKEE